MYKQTWCQQLRQRKKDSAAETIDEDSRQYDCCTGELLDRNKYITGRKKERDQLESFGVIRREATDGIHVRMKIVAHNKGDLVRWRLVSMVNQYQRHDVFAGTPAFKVFRMLIGESASHSHTEHGHRKIIAILDVAARHGRRDIRTSTGRSRARSHYRVVVDQSSLRNAERCSFVADSGGGCQMCVTKLGVWVMTMMHACVHEDDFMVESRIDVFQDVKAMSEHRVGINVISIIGLGQGTEAKIVKRVLSWSPAGFTWKANPKQARDLIAWAVLEPSKAAAASPGTAATAKTMRNAPDELPWSEPKPYPRLEAQRPTSRWIGPHHCLQHPQSKSRHCKTESANRSETETSCSVFAG